MLDNSLRVHTIKALLNEAALAGTSNERLFEIQKAFANAVYEPERGEPTYFFEERHVSNVLRGIAEGLFRDAITVGCRDALPGLLPVFVKLCGPRAEGRYGNSCPAYSVAVLRGKDQV